MAEKGLKILEDIRRRRKESLAEGRLIHPEPLLAEIRRKRKRILFKPESTLGVLTIRAGDFAEAIARNLRSFDFWTAYASILVASRLVTSFLGL